MTDETLMSTAQVAEYLNLHPQTIVSLVERGELNAYKVSRHWRYRKSDVDAFLEQKRTLPKTGETETKGSANEPE